MIVIDDLRSHPDAQNFNTVADAMVFLVRHWVHQQKGYQLDTIDLLLLDFDMGPDQDIMDIVNFLIFAHHNLSIEQVLVHSMNSVGSQAIVDRLRPFWPTCQRIDVPKEMLLDA